MPAARTTFNLYPKSRSPQLDLDLFLNPASEYRGAPFWAWNSKLDIPQLLRQIDHLKSMGFGGFNMHARTGLATEYLGDEFMSAIVACTEKAAKENMLSWLYDEDRWPSGFAGGLVTREPQHRVKHLLWTTTPYYDPPQPSPPSDYTAPTRSESGQLLARYEVMLNKGRLARYRRLREQEPRKRLPTPFKRGRESFSPTRARIWYAYLESPLPSVWFNGETYVDVFSPDAIARFLETTHDRFAATVGTHFGSVIPAIFTDEPQFTKKGQLSTADDTRDIFLPFTTDFPDTFRATYKQDLLDHLPELFWNLENDAPSLVRYRYHDHTAERFASAFADRIGDWCGKHRIALTGHLLGEGTLHSQTRGIGEAMRPLRSFHIPGIDVLSDKMELVTAKQAQSVARQFGRSAMLSEMYGVTNWDFDFIGHKAQGDWQAACGVTVRVPHLAWLSMAGEAKRDYPASISYQSPWFREYPLIENHFARVNTIMTRGKPLVRVAVIHPIESFWLAWGPREHVAAEWEQREAALRDITSWLLFGGIDFDFISEALLPTQSREKQLRRFTVGEMRYDAIVVPSLRTIRSTTLKRLASFAKSGGTLIFAGEIPTLLDAKPSPAPRNLAARCQTIDFGKSPLLKSLEPFRQVHIAHADGSPPGSILHQLRSDGKRLNLFLCNTDRSRPRNNTTIRIPGKWTATQLDTMTGETRLIPSTIESNQTIIPWTFNAHGHLLVTLGPHTKHSPPHPPPTPSAKWVEFARLNDPVRISLSEPNVLLLDQPAWRINGGDWQDAEEILRLDNKVRGKSNLPLRSGRAVQPWADHAPAPVLAQLQLRYTIRSDVSIPPTSLAIEDPSNARIHLDSRPIPNQSTGWWVDEAIKTIPLPPLRPGEHELMLTIPFTRKTDLEACHLLGDFGVAVAGRHAKLIGPVRTLAFGDWTHQGLPFYAGNVTYHCTLDGSGAETMIEIPKFKNPLLSISLDSQPAGKIAFAPFQLRLGQLEGHHTVDITAFGNRVNTFGALHNANEKLTWFGPPAWRSTGADWTYAYQFKPTGILVAPTIKSA